MSRQPRQHAAVMTILVTAALLSALAGLLGWQLFEVWIGAVLTSHDATAP